jgi:hypothetical protein
MLIRTVPAYKCEIYIGGDLTTAKKSCREFCDEVGLCVTVDPTTYVYSGGEEDGVVVGLINYGRFPTDQLDIQNKARRLGAKLLVDLDQQSFTIQDEATSTWFSERPEDNPPQEI